MLSCRYSLSIIFLATLLCGCPKTIPKPDNAIEDPNELVGAVNARVDQVESVRFREVVLEYFGDGERFKVRQLLLAKKPSFVRVQTRVPGTEEILNLLVSNGDTFAMHRRDTNEYLTGPATPQNIAKLLPVDLSANDVMRVMFGGAPWDRWNSFCGFQIDYEPGPENASARPILNPDGTVATGDGSKVTMKSADAQLDWDGKEGGYLLSKECSDSVLKMWVRHTDYAVTKVEELKGGKTKYRYSTDDWKRFGKIALPQYRQFEIPDRDLDFSIDVKEVEIDPNLPEILFELEPPEGSSITNLP